MAMRVSRSGGLARRHKAPFEPRADTVFQLGSSPSAGRSDVTTNLLSRFIERVERVEELLLCLLLAGDELDIVHQEKIGAAVFGAQILAAADLDGVDEIVREIVALDVYDLRLRIFRVDRAGRWREEGAFCRARSCRK